MQAPHHTVPRWPSEAAEMATQEIEAVAVEGGVCFALADDIGRACDRWHWDAEDAAIVSELRHLLDEAAALARRIGR